MATAIGDLVATLGMNNRPFIAKINRSQSRLMAFAGRTKAALGSIAAAFLPLSAGYAFVSLIRSGETFNQKMRQSQAIMGDLTDAMKRDMRSAAFEIARHTSFAASEAAESFYFLVSAGLDAKQSLAALPKVAQFAQAGNFNLSVATSLLTDSLSALGMKSKDPQENMRNMVRLSDVLVRATTLADATTLEFAEALAGPVAGYMRTYNRSLEEGVAMLALLAERGVKGREASDKAMIMYRDIPRAVNAATDAWKNYGISVADGSGKLLPMAEIVKNITAALGPMSDMERAAAVENMRLTRSVRDVIYKLLEGSEELHNFQKALEAAGEITKEVADKQLTVWQKLWAFLSSGATQVGSAITAGLGKGLEWLGQFSSQFKAVGAGIYELWTVYWGNMSEFAGGIMEILGYKSGMMADAFLVSLQFIADTFSALAFVARNFSAFAQIAFIELVSVGLELFPMLERPLQAVAANFIGTWAGIKAFFSSIVGNIIGGLQEIANFAKAVGVGIAAAWEQLMAGNFSGIGAAFGDAFMQEFINQADVKAPNAFKAFGDAYKNAAGEFNERVGQSGGMTGYLGQQRKDLLDEIAKDEAARKLLPERSAVIDTVEVAAKGLVGKAMPGAIGVTGEKKELPKIMERGSQEAWKFIVGAMYKKESPADKAARDTADHTRRTADATEKIVDREPEEVGI